MKTLVKIVKRGRADSRQQPQLEQKQETKKPSDREIAITIKRWITDREQRRRLVERTDWDMLSRFAQ